jgi:predicted metal-dependent hydrolase
VPGDEAPDSTSTRKLSRSAGERAPDALVRATGERAPGTVVRAGTILQHGRAKAYRPLPPKRRREILAEGLAAYGRGDFFLAHELLEPAWMGASDLAERDLYQGLIKLAAAFVHEARGNPQGVAKNLRGARTFLADALPSGAGAAAGTDLPPLIAAIDRRLEGEDPPEPIQIGQIPTGGR